MFLRYIFGTILLILVDCSTCHLLFELRSLQLTLLLLTMATVVESPFEVPLPCPPALLGDSGLEGAFGVLPAPVEPAPEDISPEVTSVAEGLGRILQDKYADKSDKYADSTEQPTVVGSDRLSSIGGDSSDVDMNGMLPDESGWSSDAGAPSLSEVVHKKPRRAKDKTDNALCDTCHEAHEQAKEFN